MDTFDAIRRQLEGYGIQVTIESVDTIASTTGELTATLIRRHSSQTYHVVHGEALTLADVTRVAGRGDHPLLVWSTVIQPRTATAFRQAGIQYTDAAGNASLRFGDVFVEVRGRKASAEVIRRTPEHRSANLFSAGRSKVIFALLTWPRLWGMSTRDLAESAGVSVGLAHDTLKLLDQSGYGRYSKRVREHGLLEPWAAAFATGLAPQLLLASYRGDVGGIPPRTEPGAASISGECAAADLIRPTTLVMYVDRLDPHLAIDNRWRADGLPNIFVRHRFWRDPDQPEPTRLGPNPDAPWTIVYADLVSNDDPRLQAVAQVWKDRHVDAAPSR